MYPPEPGSFKKKLLAVVLFNAIILAAVLGITYKMYRDVVEYSEQDWVNGIYVFVDDPDPSVGISIRTELADLDWVREVIGWEDNATFGYHLPLRDDGSGTGLVLVWTEWVAWDDDYQNDLDLRLGDLEGVSAYHRVKTVFEEEGCWNFLSGKDVRWRTLSVTLPDGFDPVDFRENYTALADDLEIGTGARVLIPANVSAMGEAFEIGDTFYFHIFGIDIQEADEVMDMSLQTLGNDFLVDSV